MSKVRKLPGVVDRVETGPVQFGDDWPGVFIRGDNAAMYAMALHSLLNEEHDDPIAEVVVIGLLKTLNASNLAGGIPENMIHAPEEVLIKALRKSVKVIDNDLDTCPNCGGPADNGYDRSYPPAPYFCTKCMESR